MSDVRFLSWDWKQNVAANSLVTTINEFQGGPIYATVVDTGTEDYVIALARERLTSDQAFAAWEASCGEADPEMS